MASWFKDLRAGAEVQPPAQPVSKRIEDGVDEVEQAAERRQRLMLEVELRRSEQKQMMDDYESRRMWRGIKNTVGSMFWLLIIGGIAYFGIWAAPKAIEYGQELRGTLNPSTPLPLNLSSSPFDATGLIVVGGIIFISFKVLGALLDL